jgi:phage tail sheath gpL-like
MVAFNSIGNDLRTPFVAVEFDNTRASQGPSLLAYRALLIGQKISGGTATADTVYRVTSADDVLTLAGRGSQLHRMAIAWFASNTSTEVWIGVLDDDGSAVAATGTITVTGPATAAGTISLWIGGTRVTVAVADGDAQNDIATAIDAAINANADLPVTSGVATNVVTLTARNGGEVGNGLDVRDSYRDGEALPAGVALAYVAPASGATNPALTNLIAALGDTWYQIIAHPFTDATSLTAIENEISDRNGPLRMIDGVAVTSAAGTAGTLTTLGNGRNSEFSSIVAQPGANPLTWPPEFAAESAALAAFYGAIDPARPFQTLAYSHALPPAEVDYFTLQERNLLLFDGIATSEVAAGDVVQIGRLITTYQTNGAGAPDTSYLDVTTRLTLLYLRYSFRVRMQTRFPRHKLADDGVRLGSGQVVMTPSLGKAEALNWFRDMESLGLVENFDQFKTDLVVERNDVDPNRLDFLLPPDLINSLIVTAAQIQFRL